MFASSVDPDIAPSGTLLGLLQRGRGDGTLHALAASRSEALAALRSCVLNDPRRDWQLENRSLYYARLHRDLRADLAPIEAHLLDDEDPLADPERCQTRTGLALSVLGHLTSYGDRRALTLLRRYATVGVNWQWALDELAVRDDDEGLRPLGPAVLARFPNTPEGDRELATAARDAFEPRPWRLWAEDTARPGQGQRLKRLDENRSFDRWQRQLHSAGPRPGWSLREVLDWADAPSTHGSQARESAAARLLVALATPGDRPRLRAVAGDPDAGGSRLAALRYLAEQADTHALSLIEEAAADPEPTVADTAVAAFARMRDATALEQARHWASRTDALGTAAARMLARHGTAEDGPTVLAALRWTLRVDGPHSDDLTALVDGAGRLGIDCAAPLLRHIYRETASSLLRERAARALACTDPRFPSGFAIECLWDCEEATRELGAAHATTGDERVMERLRGLAVDPAEETGVQDAVRERLSPDGGR
ncbi:HEAT repeat domain-containing protein [Streptomyces sp. NPDC005438]|uniref:HEAT repeat domain-containing protein n=1 Tax=Streptomyces sp. NPDC005438 TaxID=3156880 RepID=UPI0033BB8AF7